jgi:predicted kinase
MRNLILTIGIPGSGKTTFCKEFLLNNPNYIRISRDDIRLMNRFDDTTAYHHYEKLITNQFDLILTEAFNSNFNVIIDNTNLKISNIKQILNVVSNFEFNLKFKILNTPLEDCIQRVKLRDNNITPEIVEKCKMKFDTLMKFPDYLKIITDYNVEFL